MFDYLQSVVLFFPLFFYIFFTSTHFIVTVMALIFHFFPDGSSGDGKESGVLHLGKPDDVEVSIELKNWLFALEGEQEMAERWWFNHEDVGREERCWHTTFHNLHVKAKGSPKHMLNGNGKSYRTEKYPVELVTVRISHSRHCLSLSF